MEICVRVLNLKILTTACRVCCAALDSSIDAWATGKRLESRALDCVVSLLWVRYVSICKLSWHAVFPKHTCEAWRSMLVKGCLCLNLAPSFFDWTTSLLTFLVYFDHSLIVCAAFLQLLCCRARPLLSYVIWIRDPSTSSEGFKWSQLLFVGQRPVCAEPCSECGVEGLHNIGFQPLQQQNRRNGVTRGERRPFR